MLPSTPTTLSPAATRQNVVERAEAFVRNHLADPVAIQHLCRVTGVSERTLRNAFREVRGVSPKRFMLRARLEKTREALRRGDRQSTVTTIATNFGFCELGRFANRYKAVFGEYPSDTLRIQRRGRSRGGSLQSTAS